MTRSLSSTATYRQTLWSTYVSAWRSNITLSGIMAINVIINSLPHSKNAKLAAEINQPEWRCSLNQRCTSPDADEQQPNTTTVVLKSRLCAGLSSSSKTSFWGCLSTHRQAKPLLQTQKYAKSVIESCSRRRSQNKWTAPHKPNKAWLNDPVCSDLLFTRGGEWTRSWLSSLLLTRWT